jgi:hypothetical protein
VRGRADASFLVAGGGLQLHRLMHLAVTITAAISCVGDAAVIIAWLSLGPCAPQSMFRPTINFSVRFVAYLAFADLLASGCGLVNNSMYAIMPAALCEASALLEWFMTFATWLWTAAIAFAFHACFSEGCVDVTCRTEIASHLVCWGGPVVLLGSALALGSKFGPPGPTSAADPSCTWQDSTVDT